MWSRWLHNWKTWTLWSALSQKLMNKSCLSTSNERFIHHIINKFNLKIEKWSLYERLWNYLLLNYWNNGEKVNIPWTDSTNRQWLQGTLSISVANVNDETPATSLCGRRRPKKLFSEQSKRIQSRGDYPRIL